jgi:mannose-1-phosphate guanylyltransferase/mannose-6-phosphate isomerase
LSLSSASITPVVLCGGSGTRRWPLSRKSFPRQFVPLIDGKSLLQLTLERVSLLSRSVICVVSEDHRFLVSEAMQAAKGEEEILLTQNQSTYIPRLRTWEKSEKFYVLAHCVMAKTSM